MEILYRGTPPSLLERAFARLVRHGLLPTAPVHRLDLVYDVVLEIRRS